MGAKGRRNVEAHFDIERQSEELENIYQEVLDALKVMRCRSGTGRS